MAMAPYSSGSCQCGLVSMSIDVKPFLSYACHCSHCRGFASRYLHDACSYHSGAAVWKWNVFIKGNEHIDYEHSSSLGGLFAMSRGRCSKCKQPIWESGKRVIFPFAMVMGESLLPNLKPEVDIYYDSGHQRGAITSKVLSSDLGSLAYEIYIILFVAIPEIPWSIFKRLTRKVQFSDPSRKDD